MATQGRRNDAADGEEGNKRTVIGENECKESVGNNRSTSMIPRERRKTIEKREERSDGNRERKDQNANKVEKTGGKSRYDGSPEEKRQDEKEKNGDNIRIKDRERPGDGATRKEWQDAELVQFSQPTAPEQFRLE
jgi:hypothetical protein